MPCKANSSVALFTTASVSDAWENLLRPWFQEAASDAWRQQERTAVVVPSRSYALFLRQQLLQHGISLFGVRFLTPLSLRELIALELAMAPRENLGLLLAIAAEAQIETAASSRRNAASETLATTARSIARAPDALLSAIEQAAAAGWSFQEIAAPALKKICGHFERSRQDYHLYFPYEIDQAVCAIDAPRPPIFHRLLIAGFDGAHWPFWFLLQAAVRRARNATVLLHDPREEARVLDEAWIGTWEEAFKKNAETIPSSALPNETLFPELFAEGGLAHKRKAVHFLVGRTVTDQAAAIVALTQSFLADDSADRIGILFPSSGALPRAVASQLAQLEIPHDDSIGHLVPGPLEDTAWPAWLELQENPRLRILLRFLRASPAAAKFFGGLDVERIEDILRRAYRELLIDDLQVLCAFCEASAREDVRRVALGLTSIRFLPPHATFAEFLSASREIFAELHWQERWSLFAAASAGWNTRVPEQFSRAIFLRWLGELGTSLLPARDLLGDHPYSRVHLVFYSHAENQSWSHLIFAGLNEGSWPPRGDNSGLLETGEIDALNARVRRLNRGAMQQGSQGEGHATVAPGKALCIGAGEQRQLAERQFRNLLESCRGPIGLAANLVEESAPERFANPSEFFAQLYSETHRVSPGQETMLALEKETDSWLARQKEGRADTETPDIRQTAVAYEARNTPAAKFGEYEFALRVPLDRKPTLSATDWERVIKAPALVWLKRFPGVEAQDEDFGNWNLATGQWVHDWLSHIAKSDGAFSERPRARDVRSRVRKAARDFRAEVADLLGRPLPDWWTSGWNQAAFIAETLAGIVAETEDWSHFATEWTLPNFTIQFSETEALTFRGRMDLLLGRDARAGEEFPFRRVWIIDYKTGRRTSLAPGRKFADRAAEDFRNKLLDGKGVQLALYALALHSLGAEEIGVSLLTRDLELDRPQVSIPVVEAQREIWEEFARMSRTGVFGMRGALRGEFQFQNDYPLATLGFDPDFLEEKWNATHAALPKIEKRP